MTGDRREEPGQPIARLWDALDEKSSTWAYVLASTDDEVDDAVAVARAERPAEARGTFIVRGERSRTKQELFHEMAAALQFPWYFGHNWDALDEVLCDMAWLPAPRYVWFFANFDALLSSDPQQRALLVDVLAGAVEVLGSAAGAERGGKRTPRELRVVFHSRPGADAEILRLFSTLGLPWTRLAVADWLAVND